MFSDSENEESQKDSYNSEFNDSSKESLKSNDSKSQSKKKLNSEIKETILYGKRDNRKIIKHSKVYKNANNHLSPVSKNSSNSKRNKSTNKRLYTVGKYTNHKAKIKISSKMNCLKDSKHIGSPLPLQIKLDQISIKGKDEEDKEYSPLFPPIIIPNK